MLIFYKWIGLFKMPEFKNVMLYLISWMGWRGMQDKTPFVIFTVHVSHEKFEGTEQWFQNEKKIGETKSKHTITTTTTRHCAPIHT